MSADSTMEQGFDGGSIKPPLESFLGDKLKNTATGDRVLKPNETRYFTTLLLQSGDTEIPIDNLIEAYGATHTEYQLTAEFLDRMGPVGYSDKEKAAARGKTRIEVSATSALLMTLTGNSENAILDNQISLVELQALVIAKFVVSARELKRQGKEIDPRLPDILVTAIDNLREGGSLKQGQNTIKPDHRFSPSLNIFNQLVPSDSSGGKAFTREFPARLKLRRNHRK